MLLRNKRPAPTPEPEAQVYKKSKSDNSDNTKKNLAKISTRLNSQIVSKRTWQGLNEKYGGEHVRFIYKSCFTVEDLFWLPDDTSDNDSENIRSEKTILSDVSEDRQKQGADDDNDSDSGHSECSRTTNSDDLRFECGGDSEKDDSDNDSDCSGDDIQQPQGPEVYVGITLGGTGVQFLRKNLANPEQHIKAKLKLDTVEHPSILHISPFCGNAESLVTNLSLDFKVCNNDELHKKKRSMICFDGLESLKNRIEGYDIIILDECLTAVLLPQKKILSILESLMMKSKTVVVLDVDCTPSMLEIFLPFINLDNPAKLYVTVNKK